MHACSQAEQASIHACITAMSMFSMPFIGIMPFDIMPIIIESMFAPSFVAESGRPAL